MNIVHLSNSIAPRWQAGGPVRLFFDYVNEISLDADLIIAVIGGVDEVKTNPYNTRVNYYPFKLKKIQFFGIKFFQISWLKLFSTLIKVGPEIIVLNELRGQNVLASLIYKLIFRVTLCVHFN